jgi:hypothetical protein
MRIFGDAERDLILHKGLCVQPADRFCSPALGLCRWKRHFGAGLRLQSAGRSADTAAVRKDLVWTVE